MPSLTGEKLNPTKLQGNLNEFKIEEGIKFHLILLFQQGHADLIKYIFLWLELDPGYTADVPQKYFSHQDH